MKFLLNLTLFFAVLMLVSPLMAQETDGKDELTDNKDELIDNKDELNIDAWLAAGPFEVKKPFFDTVENLDGEIFQAKDLLKQVYFMVEGLKPVEGEVFSWPGKEGAWTRQHVDQEGRATWGKTGVDDKGRQSREKQEERTGNRLMIAAAYVKADRFIEAELKISSPMMFEVYVDGKMAFSKYIFDKEEDSIPGEKSGKIVLETGKHIILVKALADMEKELEWSLGGGITYQDSTFESSLLFSTDPGQVMDMHLLLEGVSVTSASPSPDGSLVLLSFSEVVPPEGKRSSWKEVRSDAGELVYSFRNTSVSGLRWNGQGNRLSYRVKGKKGSSIWVLDLDLLEEYPVMTDVEDIGGYRWAPDGSYIIYGITEKPKKEKGDLSRLAGMPDRWPWFRSREQLYRYDLGSGIKERLTYGYLSSSLHDISPDSRYLVFSQQYTDFSERPYTKQVLLMMDLTNHRIDTIWVSNYSGGVSFSPDGKSLLVTGSPVMFGDEGNNVTNGWVPNDFDSQAYIYDLESNTADCITRSFKPAVLKVHWHKTDGNIYILGVDRTFKSLFRYDVGTGAVHKIESGLDVIGRINFASGTLKAAYTGSSITTPGQAYLLDLESGDYRLMAAPQEEKYEHVVFGKTEEWVFESSKGVTIDGRVYYPPGFNPSRPYPLIVYYYGGTSPTSRSFGGRYPKNLFAAQGYVVYVLQPGGATGYGQNFSAMHVNNWGITTADEIIEGTQQFVEEHPFIDSTRIGCMGASYGGFMTMLLPTRTDIFACAISHAGISSISSYWGEGYWGYTYSSGATANSFPWNNKKIYVDQSPLFNADKINTPMLLLHGKNDTNVPPGESYQLYTALKLLGKTVELVEVKDQDHHILDYKKRIEWQKTILAWFDRWLKEQPEWWDKLYPLKPL